MVAGRHVIASHLQRYLDQLLSFSIPMFGIPFLLPCRLYTQNIQIQMTRDSLGINKALQMVLIQILHRCFIFKLIHKFMNYLFIIACP